MKNMRFAARLILVPVLLNISFADMIAVDSSALDNINVLENVSAVIKDGKLQ